MRYQPIIFATVFLTFAPFVSAEQTVDSVDINISKSECLSRSSNVLKAAGAKLTQEIGDAVWGKRGEYTYVVLCRADKEVAFVSVNGTVFGGKDGSVMKIVNDLKNELSKN